MKNSTSTVMAQSTFRDFLLFVNAFGKSSGPTDPPPPEPEPRFLYISDLMGSIQVIDISTNLLDPNRTIPVSFPRGVAFSNINKRLYVAATDTFHAFNEDGTPEFQLSLETPVAPGQPFASRGGFRIALSPDHQFAYVTEEAGAAVEVFDLLAGSVYGHYRCSAHAQWHCYFTRWHTPSTLGTAMLQMPCLLLIRVFPRWLTVSPVGQAVSRLAVSPDGQNLYLNNTRAGRVLKVNTSTKAIADSLILGQGQ